MWQPIIARMVMWEVRLGHDTVECFCPTCNCVVAADIRATASGPPTADVCDSLPDGEDGFCVVHYHLAFCPKCGGVVLYRCCETEPSVLRIEEVLYPRSTEPLAVDIPSLVRQPYESAVSCFSTGNYMPSAIMCRKTVEAMCHVLGERNGTLRTRLRRLRDAGKVEARLCDWADELRLFGNDAAHDLSCQVSKEDARDCLDFVDAIFIYVFTLDKKFQEFRKRHHPVAGPSG